MSELPEEVKVWLDKYLRRKLRSSHGDFEPVKKMVEKLVEAAWNKKLPFKK